MWVLKIEQEDNHSKQHNGITTFVVSKDGINEISIENITYNLSSESSNTEFNSTLGIVNDAIDNKFDMDLHWPDLWNFMMAFAKYHSALFDVEGQFVHNQILQSNWREAELYSPFSDTNLSIIERYKLALEYVNSNSKLTFSNTQLKMKRATEMYKVIEKLLAHPEYQITTELLYSQAIAQNIISINQ